MPTLIALCQTRSGGQSGFTQCGIATLRGDQW